MNELGLICEYENILLKKQEKFSSAALGKDAKEKDVLKLLRYVFSDLLGWTPEETRDYLNERVIAVLKLNRPVSKLNYPPEINPASDFWYIAIKVFPELPYQKKDVVLSVYQKLLSGKLKKYPKGFFQHTDSEIYLDICLQYALGHILGCTDPEVLYPRFTNKRKTEDFLRKAKLDNAVSTVYPYPIDALHEALPEEKRNEFLYWYYRFLYDLKQTRKRLQKIWRKEEEQVGCNG